MPRRESNRLVAIACGGTGGHLFPGIAVAEALQEHGCDVTLLISPKDVDQQAVRSAVGMEVTTLPAVAMTRGHLVEFLRGFWHSYRASEKRFQAQPPQAVLAMGGFTSAPPVLAGKRHRAATFVHEANTIPGRANRWLAPWVDQAFVGFPETSLRLRNASVTVTGTPVRPQFQAMDPGSCRLALGLDPKRATVLVMGGSQGATGINNLMIRALPILAALAPALQFVHLTGPTDGERVRAAYAAHDRKAMVRPFLTEMEYALGAACLAVSRAGASSLAEFAAMQLPAVLIPYPTAANNHQFHNAQALVRTGAARMLDQKRATPQGLAALILGLVHNEEAATEVRRGLRQWQTPYAAKLIAEHIVMTLGGPHRSASVAAAEDYGGSTSGPVPHPPLGSEPTIDQRVHVT